MFLSNFHNKTRDKLVTFCLVWRNTGLTITGISSLTTKDPGEPLQFPHLKSRNRHLSFSHKPPSNFLRGHGSCFRCRVYVDLSSGILTIFTFGHTDNRTNLRSIWSIAPPSSVSWVFAVAIGPRQGHSLCHLLHSHRRVLLHLAPETAVALDVGGDDTRRQHPAGVRPEHRQPEAPLRRHGYRLQRPRKCPSTFVVLFGSERPGQTTPHAR